MELKKETIEEIDSAIEKENLRKIEAVLFISGKFLSIKELVALTDINPLFLRELLEKLKKKYESDETALALVNKEDIWKMDVKPEFSNIINKIATGNSEFTKAEQETLAVISYKQPIKQSVIVKIRGNKAYEHVKKFEELGLIKSKKMGHTKELTLSPEFYDYFHGNETENQENLENKNSENIKND
jgi:segregation and condensation protein B